MLMAAATMDIPAICMVRQTRKQSPVPRVHADTVIQNVGPMLNGYAGSKYVGSGMVVWDSRAQLSAGEIDQDQFMRQVSLSAPR